MAEPKKLYRSRSHRIIAGVFGGLGEYLNVDPNVLRLIWIVITVLTGFVPGLIIYLAAAVVIPEERG